MVTTGPGLPPLQYDRGLRPWVICLGSFFLMFNSFGLVNSFGVFQTFYQEQALPGEPASSIAWIGSLQASLLTSVGMVAGPVFDRGHVTLLLSVGSACVVAGTMLMGICKVYWQFLLCQGVVVGVGTGCLMLPSMAILSQYFKKKLGLAVGIGSSGSAIGGVCFPLFFERLQPILGFRNTVWLMAGIMACTLLVCIASVHVRLHEGQARRLFEAKAWTEMSFVLWASYLFISLVGLYLPSYYIQLYGLQYMEKDLAIYLLPVANAGSFFGRIIPLYFLDLVGAFNLEIPLTLCASLILFMWATVSSARGLFAFSACYGFLLGAIVTVCTPIDIAMCPTWEVVGVRMGMLCIPWSLGLLLGPPVGGLLLAQDKGWLAVQAFGGATLFVAALLAVGTRIAKYGSRVIEKC